MSRARLIRRRLRKKHLKKNSLGCARGEQRTAPGKASSSLYFFQKGGSGERRGCTTYDVPAPGYLMPGDTVGGVTYGCGMGGRPSGAAHGTANSKSCRQGRQGHAVPQTMHCDNAQTMQEPRRNPQGSAVPVQRSRA